MSPFLLLATVAGSTASLIDHAETVGVVLRTRDGINPVYVAIGHRIALADAIAVVMSCVTCFAPWVAWPSPGLPGRRHVCCRRRCTRGLPGGLNGSATTGTSGIGVDRPETREVVTNLLPGRVPEQSILVIRHARRKRSACLA